MALVYLFASEDADVVGIASTAGNVPVQQVCENNLGLLELCGLDIPVSKGSEHPIKTPLRTAEDTHGPKGMGYAQLPATDRQLTAHDAADAWVRAAHEHPGELVAVSCRPADQPGTGYAEGTGAAEAAASSCHHGRRVRLPRQHHTGCRVERQRGPGGRRRGLRRVGGGVGAEAAGRHLPIVLGLNLTENIAMTPTLLSRLATVAASSSIPMSVLDNRGTRSVASNPLIAVLEDAMRFYFEFHFDQSEGYLAHLHDPLAAAVALDPDLVSYRRVTVDVELTGTLTRGMTIADWSSRWGREPNALIGVGVDPEMFFDRFISRVGPFAASCPDWHSIRRCPPHTTCRCR